MVYIMEAHPVDAWQDDDNLKENIHVVSPINLEERCVLAETCRTKLALKIPPLIDGVLNTAEVAYTAWPDRLYLVGPDGRVAYKSKPGPYGFKPGEMAEALKRMLPTHTPQAETPK